jgi:glycosyltransferase involved in cell wall biosynthesis
VNWLESKIERRNSFRAVNMALEVNTMRIAQVAPLYESVPPKYYGGTERVVSYLTEELVRLGHDVTLYASGDSVTKARLVSTCCPHSLRLSKCLDRLSYHVVMLEQVMRDTGEFDIIHFHTDYLHFPLTRREKTRDLTTLHGRLDIPELVPLYEEFEEVPLISISDAQRLPLAWLNWKGTVHHGLPPENFRLYPKAGKYLAFLGRISPEKGPDHAIELAKQTGIPLKIAAKVDKADVEYFKEVVEPLLDSELVEFVGEITEREKNEFLGKAYAFLFPISWPEPFGLVMIEAMACGTPVIAYPGGSVREIVEDGLTGFVVENGRQAVRAISRIPTLSRPYIRQRFEKRFSAGRMASDYIAIYEELACQENAA